MLHSNSLPDTEQTPSSFLLIISYNVRCVFCTYRRQRLNCMNKLALQLEPRWSGRYLIILLGIYLHLI